MTKREVKQYLMEKMAKVPEDAEKGNIVFTEDAVREGTEQTIEYVWAVAMNRAIEIVKQRKLTDSVSQSQHRDWKAKEVAFNAAVLSLMEEGGK